MTLFLQNTNNLLIFCVICYWYITRAGFEEMLYHTIIPVLLLISKINVLVAVAQRTKQVVVKQRVEVRVN